MDLTDILASILNPNGSQQASAMPAMQAPPSWTRAVSSFGMAPQQPSQTPMPVPQMQMPAPSVPTQAMQQSQPTPQAQPSPQTAQAGPGGFLTDLLMPKTAAKNRTAAYLQQQGMDAGTANLLVSDPQMLSTYLQQKLKGVGPTTFDQRADAAKQYGLDPSTPEGRNFILTGNIPGASGQGLINAGGGQIYDPVSKSWISAPQAQGGTDDNAKAIAGAIINGDQPPDMKGLYKFSGPVRAELAKQGFDLSRANEDWMATQRHLASLNGPQQLRLRQAVDFASQSTDLVDQLAAQWDAGRFPLLNAANLTLAKQGAYGQEAASLATRMGASIADLTSELGTVYKGGNSSTDETLRLAAQNLNENWSTKTIHDATDQIRKTLVYRQNSLKNIGVAGVPNGGQYDPNKQDETPSLPQGNAAPVATPQAAPQPAAPAAPAAQPAPPAVGEIRYGYRFKGGDPSERASWEK